MSRAGSTAFVERSPGVYARVVTAPQPADVDLVDAAPSYSSAMTCAAPAETPDATPVSPARASASDDAFAAAQDALLDGMLADLQAEARSWAGRVLAMTELEALHAAAGGERFDVLDMAGTWQVSQATATRWRSEADRLTRCLPGTLAALGAGVLLVHQAQVLLHRTVNCTEQVAREVETRVLPAAAGLYPAELGKLVDRTVLEVEAELAGPQAAEQRHADAAAGRRTWTKTDLDGMGLAGAVLTAEQLLAWQAGMDQLEQAERTADRQAGVERTADQRRADLFAALPAMVLAGTAQDTADDLAGQPRRPWTLGPEQLAAHVVLNVHVPLATVLDLAAQPGTLERYGPISPAHVRLLVPRSVRRVLVDADTGRPVAVDDARPAASTAEGRDRQYRAMLTPTVITDLEQPRHDPSPRLARLVDIRDVHCCGPGCSSTRTDRDHHVPYPHGPTSAANLTRLSRRCHRAKHHGWTLTRHPDGASTWTSPTGRSYRRPSPHTPPPRADLHQHPTPRPRPVGHTDPDDQPDKSPAPPPPAPPQDTTEPDW